MALRQAEALARRGHRVAVVSPDAAPALVPALPRALRAVVLPRARASSPRRTCGSRRSGGRSSPRSRARTARSSTCARATKASSGFYRGELAEIERPTALPTRKLAISARPGGAAREARFRSGDGRRAGLRRAGFFPGPARPPADPPIVLVVGPLEADVQGRRDRACAASLSGAAAAGRFRLRRISYSPLHGGGEAISASRTSTTTGSRPSACPSRTGPRTSSSGPRGSRRASACRRSRPSSCGIPALLSDMPGQREIGGRGRPGISATATRSLWPTRCRRS